MSGLFKGKESAPPVAEPVDTEKAFATMRARLALVGYTLARSDPKDGHQALYVTRWGLVKALASLEEVERLAVQLGAPG